MFLPENIDLAHSEKYSLSIRLVSNGFSFCIYNPTDAEVFHFQETHFGEKKTYLENIQKLIFDYGFFTQPFKETRVTIVSPNYTIVPDAFFEEKKKKELFAFNFNDAEGTILSKTLLPENLHFLFQIEEDLHSFLCRNVWNPQFTHHASALISAFSTYKVLAESNRCFVDFHDNFISVFCFNESKLLSANTYATPTTGNALYFIASVWEQLPLDQSKDRLFISGNSPLLANTVETLKKLIKNIEFTDFQQKMAISPEQKKAIPTDLLVQL